MRCLQLINPGGRALHNYMWYSYLHIPQSVLLPYLVGYFRGHFIGNFHHLVILKVQLMMCDLGGQGSEVSTGVEEAGQGTAPLVGRAVRGSINTQSYSYELFE